MHLGTLFLEDPQCLVPSTSGIISPVLTMLHDDVKRDTQQCSQCAILQQMQSVTTNLINIHMRTNHRWWGLSRIAPTLSLQHSIRSHRRHNNPRDGVGVAEVTGARSQAPGERQYKHSHPCHTPRRLIPPPPPPPLLPGDLVLLSAHETDFVLGATKRDSRCGHGRVRAGGSRARAVDSAGTHQWR